MNETCGCEHDGHSLIKACDKHEKLFVKDQPPPKPGEGDMWQLVIDDMKERRQTGIERYGTPLQAFNGRSSLVDWYQELLDAAVYARQRMVEEAALMESLQDAQTHADMAEAYYKTLEAHLREHGCQHDFAEVANGPSSAE